MDVAALILAGLALLFSAYSFFRQFRLQHKLTEIEEARRHDEVASGMTADVTASFEQYATSGGHTGYRLVLGNRGPARADNVSFELAEPAEGWAPSLIMQGHDFPIPLDPGQRYAVMASVAMGTSPSVRMTLRWVDETGPHEKHLTLTIF